MKLISFKSKSDRNKANLQYCCYKYANSDSQNFRDEYRCKSSRNRTCNTCLNASMLIYLHVYIILLYINVNWNGLLPPSQQLKVVGCLLSCTLSCPIYLYMEVVGSLICMAAHGQPSPLSTELPNFF